MSTPVCIEVGGASRGPFADNLLESDSPSMSHHETQSISSVLVVSAYPDHRARLAELLASQGHRVSQADDAVEALEKIKSQKFDLVVTGIQMRHMDGLELLRIVRETIPNLPVIAIGDANAEMNVVYLRCAELLGVFQTHSFPPDPDRFLDGVRRAIRQHRIRP
jgi:DNA-binding NtrC family response regulator